ncbi:hypothetical protein NEOKW01_1051 [Nematocida sp. AWRm80]|nr:hypothetical protein NEOKW01_1051 [Nematocida sp. AWRm80]
MGIQRIRISGFKTYEREEGIVFSEFTCIVGPNGVGKSNLIDGIIFVLGADLEDIRGSIHCREGSYSPEVEMEYRDKQGVLRKLKREIRNDQSVYSLDDNRVSFKEYCKYLEGENISVVYKNFFISQNESMIRVPRELTKFIDRISGSYAYKEEYKKLKERKDKLQKEYSQVNERRKHLQQEWNEYKEVQSLEKEYKEVSESIRILSERRVFQKVSEMQKRKEELESRLEALYNNEEHQKNIQLQQEMALLQVQLIKCKAEKSSLQEYAQRIEQRKQEYEEDLEKKEKELNQKKQRLLQRQTEAQQKLEDTLWKIQKIEQLSHDKSLQELHKAKESLKEVFSEIAQFEVESNLPTIKLAISETEKRIREVLEEHKMNSVAKEEEHTSERDKIISELNKDLLSTLRELSRHAAQNKETEHKGKLSYCISRLKERMPQILGRVEDLVSVEDPKYSTALNALISPIRNTVILGTEKDVLSIISGLSQAGVGRVTVLPLDRLETTKRNTHINMPLEKYIPFQSLIRVSHMVPEHKIEILLRYICRDSYLYLDTTTPLAINTQIVTLDGIIISKKGIVRKVFTSTVHQEIKDLEEKRDRILNDLRIESKKAKEAASINQSRLLSNHTSTQIKIVSEEHQRLVEFLDAKKEALAKAEASVLQKKKDLLSSKGISPVLIESIVKEDVFDLENTQKEYENTKNRSLKWRNTLDQITAQIEDLEQAINTQQHQTEEPNTKKTIEKIEKVQERIDHLENRLLQISESIDASLEVEIKILKDQISTLTNDLDEAEQYIAEEGLLLTQAKDTVQTHSNSKTVHSKKDKDNLSQSSQIHQIPQVPEETKESKENEERVDLQIHQLEKDLERIRQTLKTKKIVSCIEEIYSKAEQETEETKEQLLEAIRSWNQVKKERTSLFYAIFDKINSSINQHYSKLTDNSQGHVKAHLGLEVPQEPYLGGTSIFVMPTGKVFREVKYLSGGEKTMVALSLLLSIHELYPSPFYVFDELDAALDKDKICTLRSTLQSISSQFIVATHRIELFERADTLIGIARPPHSLSQVFTLRL